MRSHLVLAACLLAASASAYGADAQPLTLKWDELGPRVAGKKVAFVAPGGVALEGKVIAVEPDGLRMKVTKTSDKKAQPKGRRLVPREGITMLQVTEYGWLGRLLGSLGAMGLAGGIVAAQSIDVNEGTMVVAVPVLIGAGIAGSGVAGYYVGKRIDKRVTQIVIARD